MCHATLLVWILHSTIKIPPHCIFSQRKHTVDEVPLSGNNVFFVTNSQQMKLFCNRGCGPLTLVEELHAKELFQPHWIHGETALGHSRGSPSARSSVGPHNPAKAAKDIDKHNFVVIATRCLHKYVESRQGSVREKISPRNLGPEAARLAESGALDVVHGRGLLAIKREALQYLRGRNPLPGTDGLSGPINCVVIIAAEKVLGEIRRELRSRRNRPLNNLIAREVKKNIVKHSSQAIHKSVF
eukprot:GHVN01059410.1.p3 GENE.GHVN01059410.1~~GHVN01059410.1.p3  ORF type:complete len:242 (-),score=21.14 GHVN01059410.1:2258-2983(-)